MLITAFQRKMLEIFEKETFKTHYLSSYEARKLVSYRRDSVEAALERLKDFGFIEEVIIDTPRPPPEEILPLEKILEWFKNPPLDKNTYYVSQAMAELFKKKGTEAAIDEITEIQVIYDVLGTLMKVYPPDLIEWIQDILRTGNKDLIQSAKGLAFDVFTRFRQQDRFLAIDVYTRFPVGDEIARNFCRKIHRVGNAFGLLITKSDMATARASYLCRQNGIGFATIEELGVAYSEVRNKVKKEREFPQNLSRDRSIFKCYRRRFHKSFKHIIGINNLHKLSKGRKRRKKNEENNLFSRSCPIAFADAADRCDACFGSRNFGASVHGITQSYQRHRWCNNFSIRHLRR
jgi:hypothetical protein